MSHIYGIYICVKQRKVGVKSVGDVCKFVKVSSFGANLIECSTFLPEIAICRNLQLCARQSNKQRRTSRRRSPWSARPTPGAGQNPGPVRSFLGTQTLFKSNHICVTQFSFWSRSFPDILDTLVVPIRSDQDNKVETCLLKQSISLLSRPPNL